jgi:hypothetical protein
VEAGLWAARCAPADGRLVLLAVSLLGVPLLIDLMSLAGIYASTAALLTVFDMQVDPGETRLLPTLDLRVTSIRPRHQGSSR